MPILENVDDLLTALKEGEPIADAIFDRLYPRHVRTLSSMYWTPARVAQRAAKLLGSAAGSRVLDVGSGVGKFCIIAAAQSGATVTGIEQRAHLVRIARDVARRLRAPARFLHGDLTTIAWHEYDAFYFYNPFLENMHRDGRIDDSVELSAARFASDVAAACRALAHAPQGTRVVTYHGLGASMPHTYRLVSNECAGTDQLKLWIQEGTAGRDARCWPAPVSRA